ncbi:DUF2865 domain-containing protein [Ancylobacter sp. VNQ12]|uniref:DUF2865 domain-containing protein n=1 Tax=Ancylobacter sp. VNQ12 TaxID=3400920 RepID=UPI003C029328
MMLQNRRPFRAFITSAMLMGLVGAMNPGAAWAQDLPPGAIGGGAPQVDRSVCIRLEGQLASLDRGGGNADQPDLGAQIEQQRREIADLTAQVRQIGCDKRGFLIFQPQLPPQCDALNRRLTQARSALDRTMMSAQGQRGGIDEQRRQLIYALAQNNCGAQYQAALGQPQGGNAPAQRRAPRNFFEQLFGVPRTIDEESGPLDVQPLEMPKVSTYRTVCVRTCDGFFFPVSYAATPAKFSSDEAQCQRQCPGTEARLFAYRNPGEDIEQAVGTNGQSYMSLPNALLYKKQYVAACSCRPAGMSWAQALTQQDDPTLRKGDIVVTEDASREMAQPRPATPAPASKKP